MTTNEREIAIREGHKIHAETSYFTPRPQLDFENARHVFCEGFDRGYIAATAEANKRIAELKRESELTDIVIVAKEIQLNDKNLKISELQAHNNNLREVLEEVNALNINWVSDVELHTLEYFSEYKAVIKMGNEALATYDKLSEVKHDTK